MPKPSTCGKCGEEIRHGIRDGATSWWHRQTVDHIAVLGRMMTEEDKVEIERQLDLPRTRTVTRSRKVDGEMVKFEEQESYTVRELDLVRHRKSKKFRDQEALERDEDEEVEIVPPPPVEVWAHDFDPSDFAPRSGIRQVINLIPKQGWELISVRHARGPYMGSKGECLSISDTHVVKARSPRALDGSLRVAVASWRDGKFDFAFIGTIKDRHLDPRKVDATTMKNWIKGIE